MLDDGNRTNLLSHDMLLSNAQCLGTNPVEPHPPTGLHDIFLVARGRTETSPTSANRLVLGYLPQVT